MLYLWKQKNDIVKAYFEVVFLEDAKKFLESLDQSTIKKIIYNIDKSRYINDPKLFKKLTQEIWEFRTKHNGIQYRFFAFWDKSADSATLVIVTHAIIKKMRKIPKTEINKTILLMNQYFNQK